MGYGGDGGKATSAMLNNPHGVAVDKAGNIYIADTNNFVVREVDTSGTISTVAGIAGQVSIIGPAPEGVPATTVPLVSASENQWHPSSPFLFHARTIGDPDSYRSHRIERIDRGHHKRRN